MKNIADTVEKLCEEAGIVLDPQAVQRLTRYAELLIEKNKVMNLTAITEPQEIAVKHFFDSLLPLSQVDIPQGASVIDVGTGAGFPGLVLKIARPDIKLTLLDSLNKRLIFLNEVITALNLEKIKTVHLRAEEAGKSKAHREKYDIATARAVAALPVLLEYCTPLVKKGGSFIAMKGPSAAEEAENSKNAIKVLRVSEPKIICETLTGNEQRVFVSFKKISQTPPKYPRKPSDISKQPL